MKKIHILLGAFLILAVGLSACNLLGSDKTSDPSDGVQMTLDALSQALAVAQTQAAAPTATPEPTSTPEPIQATATPFSEATLTHLMTPGEPPAEVDSKIWDTDSSSTAVEKSSRGGDYFDVNWYERPFNANTMDIYFPQIDITGASLARTVEWIYVSIQVKGPKPEGGFDGVYGVELDLNADGRGDWLIMAANPGATWSTDGVQVWQDKNGDIGNKKPINADPPQTGDGYETLVFDEGKGADPDYAWARLSSKPNEIQLAFKYMLIGADPAFLWGVWTATSPLNVGWFDFNDHFTFDEAGSPMKGYTAYYPLKQLAEVDNTCRWYVGFIPVGNEKGICPLPPTPTPTSTPLLAKIYGFVYHDLNHDLKYQEADEVLSGATVKIYQNTCASPGKLLGQTITNKRGHYQFTELPNGSYCVHVDPDPIVNDHKTGPQTVYVQRGDEIMVNFGYYYILK